MHSFIQDRTSPSPQSSYYICMCICVCICICHCIDICICNCNIFLIFFLFVSVGESGRGGCTLLSKTARLFLLLQYCCTTNTGIVASIPTLLHNQYCSIVAHPILAQAIFCVVQICRRTYDIVINMLPK